MSKSENEHILVSLIVKHGKLDKSNPKEAEQRKLLEFIIEDATGENAADFIHKKVAQWGRA